MVTTTPTTPAQPTTLVEAVKKGSQTPSEQSTIGGTPQTDTFVSSVSSQGTSTIIGEIVAMNDELTYLNQVSTETQNLIINLYHAFEGYDNDGINEFIQALTNPETDTDEQVNEIIDNEVTQGSELQPALRALREAEDLTPSQSEQIITTLALHFSSNVEVNPTAQ